jgi:hypothetical protein
VSIKDCLALVSQQKAGPVFEIDGKYCRCRLQRVVILRGVQ